VSTFRVRLCDRVSNMKTISAEPIHASTTYRSATYFGPYRLCPISRRLQKDGVPVVLGSRALDILIVLVERAGQVVSAKDLIARAWRGLVVDPTNLRTHVMKLRKALGEEQGYIINVPGLGYSFIAPIHDAAGHVTRALEKSAHTLAPPSSRVFGREEALRLLDNCEHVIEAIASLAELLQREARELSAPTASSR
jgi:DNA-binding winged helix-turn-helix (wHTH) protein